MFSGKGEGVSSVRIFCGQGGGGLPKRISAFFGAKNNFRNLWCVRTDKGEGLSQCGHLWTRGRGKFFAILCGGLLWMAPNKLFRK